MRRTAARVLIDPETEEERFLLEGPRRVVVGGSARLCWVNIQVSVDSPTGQLFVTMSPDGNTGYTSIGCPDRPGFILPIAGGDRVIVGLGKQLRVCNLASGGWSEPIAVIPDTNPRTIINDAEIVPGGKAIVFGTKDTQFKEPIANLCLYTVDDNTVSLLADRQTCSNGKVFGRDARGLVLFDIDTPTRKVVRYRLDVADRSATPDGVAIDLAEQAGFPDGMCDCGDGTVIIAFYNPEPVDAGKAIRFDLTTGKALEEWLTPGSPRVTCPLLVNESDGVKLILTTATEGMPADMSARCPNAGSLFLAETSFTACPDPEVVRLPR